MSLQLLTITDPRDNLDKARRTELVAYGKAHGVEVTEQMPAMLIRRKLRELGLTNIRIPNRVLGQPEMAQRAAPMMDAPLAPGEKIVVVDAEADLARQYERTAPKNAHTMAYNEVRRAAKGIGLTFGRKDNLASMRAKLAVAMQKGPGGG